MPIFFQHQINEDTRLGIWKIEETEEFFLSNVPLQKEVTHPHKRLQHLAGRFLLQFLFPGFPYELIHIANTRKPFLPNEEYHFSISHCGDYAAAIVSRHHRVGIDIEVPTPRVESISNKFLSPSERSIFAIPDTPKENVTHSSMQSPNHSNPFELVTLLWSVKEAVYKWHGDGGVSFRENIRLTSHDAIRHVVVCHFTKTDQQLSIHYQFFDRLVLAWLA